MKILYKKIDEIKPNKYNPNKISKSKFDILVKNIKDEKVGYIQPVIIDKNNVIIDGEHRWKACKEAGLAKIQCVIFEGDEKKKKLLTLSLNSIRGDNDRKLLSDLVEELSKKFNVDSLIGTTGMTEIKDIVQALRYSDKEETENDVPDVDKSKVWVKPGDVVHLGGHCLVCGDSAEIENLSVLMGSDKADIVFTDPPYGVSIGAKNRMLEQFQESGRNIKDIKDDSLRPEELKVFLTKAFTNLKSVLDDEASVFVTAPLGGDLGLVMLEMMREAGLPIRHVLVWVKNAPTFSMNRLDYDYKHEPILLTWGKKHKFYGNGAQKTSVWEFDKPRSSKLHPTMKPVELIENALQNNSVIGDICVDIFGGSGSTLIACEKTGRRARLIEFEPHYCQVIIERWCQYSDRNTVTVNGKAKKITNGTKNCEKNT